MSKNWTPTCGFRIELTGTPPYTIKWFTNGTLNVQNVFDYTFTPLQSDSGMTYYVIASNSFSSAQSFTATVQVDADTTPPTIVSINDLSGISKLKVTREAEALVGKAADDRIGRLTAQQGPETRLTARHAHLIQLSDGQLRVVPSSGRRRPGWHWN